MLAKIRSDQQGVGYILLFWRSWQTIEQAPDRIWVSPRGTGLATTTAFVAVSDGVELANGIRVWVTLQIEKLSPPGNARWLFYGGLVKVNKVFSATR